MRDKTLFVSFGLGLAALGSVVALGNVTATDGDHDVPQHWIDTGGRAPRVIAFCFGSDAVYQTGDSDGIAVAANSDNCTEGGLLTANP